MSDTGSGTTIETQLLVSAQPAQLDLDAQTELSITTNAQDYEVILENDKLTYDKRDNNKLVLTAKKEGLCKIDIKATADGGTEKKITWYINVIIVPTSLTVDPQPGEIAIGQEVELTIETNAGDYQLSFSNPKVIRQGSAKNKITAIGLGECTVTVTATKMNADPATVSFTTVSKFHKPTNDDGTPVSIKLFNTSTRRTTTLSTSDNDSTRDVTINLPSYSGTLVTEESMIDTTRMITKPFIMVPSTGTSDFRDQFIATDFETALGFNGTHDQTIWQLAKDSNFKEIIKTKVYTKEGGYESMCKATLNDVGSGTYYVRVKYKSDRYESAWSPSVYVGLGFAHADSNKTPLKVVASPDASKWQPPKGVERINEVYYGAYYGTIAHSELVDDYDYRGTFNTIKNAFDPTRYTVEEDAKKLILMKKGYQVIHNDKLWYALQNMENQSKDTMIVPGESSGHWAVDERTALATPRLICDIIGIGFEINDSNANGITNGKTAINPLVNHEEGYIKYVYNGKLCYTTPKPICVDGIAWTDLAQREVCHKERTVRLGKYLYWVRLMDEEEYKEVFGRLLDGTYHNGKSSDYLLDKKVWVNDFQTGTSRNVMYFAKPETVKGSPILGNTNGEVDAPTDSNKPTIKVQNNYTRIKVGEEVDLGIAIGNGGTRWAPDLYYQTENGSLCVDFKYDPNSENDEVLKYTGIVSGIKPGKNVIDLVVMKKYGVSVDVNDINNTFTITYTIEVVEDKEIVQRGTLDPKSRTGSFRYVLEYIEEECAPYKQLEQFYNVNIPKAENENFIYDKYADVGYYGVVPADKFMTYTTLSTKTGYTAGTLQHDTAGWLKFYWHGMILYIAKKPPRYNVSWTNTKNHNCQYGWDMGGDNGKFIEVNGLPYRVANVMGSRKAPYNNTMNFSGTQTKIVATNAIQENWKYSQWGECIVRLADIYVGYEEVNNTTFGGSDLEYVGGLQCGDPFHKFTTTDIVVRHDRDGNGTGCYARETVTGTKCVWVGHAGFGFWGDNGTPSHADNHRGWRPVVYPSRLQNSRVGGGKVGG